MLEIERILDNKPIRPPMISTLALRWQSACPPGGGLGSSIGGPGGETPKDEDVSIGEEQKDSGKLSFCEIQWQQGILDNNKFFNKSSNKRLDKSSTSSSKDNIKYIRVSTSSYDLKSPLSASQQQFPIYNTRLDSNSNNNYTTNNLDTINEQQQQQQPSARQLDRNKSIDSIKPQVPTENGKTSDKIRRNSSLMNFKSLDISLKSIYASLKGGNKGDKEKTSKTDVTVAAAAANDSNNTSTASIRKAPFLKIDTVDQDESQTLLIYPQSPGGSAQHRRSFDTNSSAFLSTHQYTEFSQSRASSPYLCVSAQNIRRSSTSDIIGNKRGGSGSHSAAESRRPSTSDLLRRARERKGSEGRLGRSISHGCVNRGGGMRNRRTSMAY